MSVDRSLKVKGALKRHRNVLTREERIKVLKTEERWEDGEKVTGLPKVSHRKAGIK
jgi:small basic protein (TIGR04137 family)